ncbi:MAG: PIN domain-containing protein [Candidatus Latescibacteria bacterium]|nr:PIN domain-containing protein [Candidatus Latescibacterota bacterium]
MKAYLADTNCLLSYVTDRSPGQQEAIGLYIAAAANMDQSLYIPSQVVTEFVYVLRNEYDKDDPFIAEMLTALFDTPGIEYCHSYQIDDVLRLWPSSIRDYGDAVVAAAAIGMKIPVLTFDRKFAAQLQRSGIERELLQ